MSVVRITCSDAERMIVVPKRARKLVRVKVVFVLPVKDENLPNVCIYIYIYIFRKWEQTQDQ